MEVLLMTSMLEHFHDGGFGMFPTMIFGFLLLATSVRYALNPTRALVPLLFGLGILTLSAGALGFVTGCIVAAHFISGHPADMAGLAICGFGEALNNVAFALMFVTLAAMSASWGAWKIARGAAAQT
jgi:hypothetical protein